MEVPALPPSIVMSYEHLRLSNGLQLVLQEDHSHPVVATALVVASGSDADPPGKSGLAHLVEHLMFAPPKASSRRGYQSLLEEALAWRINGVTWPEQTVYVATAPRAALPRILWAEADRLAHHTEDVDDARIDHERRITDDERIMRTDGSRLGNLSHFLAEAMYPPGHPYRHPPSGKARDIAGLTLAEADRFFKDNYGAANLTLVVVGDFEPAKIKDLVARDFSALPSGTPHEAPKPQPSWLGGEERVFVSAGIARDEVSISWPLAPAKELDAGTIEMAAAYLRRVDRWPGIDADASSLSGGLLASSVTISFTLAPSTGMQNAVDHFDRSIATVTDHANIIDRTRLTMARSSALAGILYSLDDFSSRAWWMGNDVIRRDDAGYVSELFARDNSVTADELRATMEQVFASKRRVVCYVHADPNAPLAGKLVQFIPPIAEDQ